MSKALTPSDYFQVVLPTILRWKGPAAAALGVTVRFVVTGKGGGTWTVRLRPPAPGVVQGSEWKAELVVRITVEEMTNMLAGRFDAKKALSEGNIELAGDVTVLKRIGFLFQTGGSQADVRAVGVAARPAGDNKPGPGSTPSSEPGP